MLFSSSLKQVFQRVLRAYAAKLVARLPRGQPGLVTGTEGQVKVCTKYQLDPEIAMRFTYLQEIVNQTFMQQKRIYHVEQDGVKMALGYLRWRSSIFCLWNVLLSQIPNIYLVSVHHDFRCQTKMREWYATLWTQLNTAMKQQQTWVKTLQSLLMFSFQRV